MHRHSIYCILPPHMLDEIEVKGTPAQKEYVRLTRTVSSEFREKRHALKGVASTLSMAVGGGKDRNIYDAKFGSSLPGTLVRKEGDAPGADVTVNEAYDGAGVTYDLYKDVFGRNSIDGNGMKLISTVHFQKGYDNAFWNGEQMVYGDGDEDQPVGDRLFNRFTIAIDIIGHELTHGVTQFVANLTYANQPGALNESMSDVFGSLVKQYQKQQTAAQADWIIGEGLFTSNVNGVGIRSMKAPGTAYNDPLIGKDPQPDHMSKYVNTTSDNGGVHINSGIPNRAFYVTAVNLGGFAWEKAGHIWYVTLRDKLQANSNFQNCADFTFQTAGELYGAGSLEQQAVKAGWAEVGLTVNETGPVTPPADNPGCLPSLLKALGLR